MNRKWLILENSIYKSTFIDNYADNVRDWQIIDQESKWHILKDYIHKPTFIVDCWQLL